MFFLNQCINESDLYQSIQRHELQIKAFSEIISDHSLEYVSNDLDILRKGNEIFFDRSISFPQYDTESIMTRAYNHLRWIMNKFPFVDMSSYCDVGCGYGENPRAALMFGSNESVGIDINPRWNDICDNEKEKPRFIQADISRYPLDEKFKFITSYNAFEHFENPQLMLSRIANMVDGGGCLYIDFAPIWHSANGHHMYRRCQFPYYHLIFNDDVIKDYYEMQNSDYERYIHSFNKWSAFDFMNLLMCVPGMKLEYYETMYEVKDLYFVKCFRQLLEGFGMEELAVSGFKLLYRKM